MKHNFEMGNLVPRNVLKDKGGDSSLLMQKLN